MIEQPPPPSLGSEENFKLSSREISRSLLDWLLGFPGGFIATFIISLPFVIIWAALDPSIDFVDLADSTPIGVLALGLIIQQGTQLAIALFVQAKGFGLVKELRDWKFRIEAKDVFYGLVALPVLFIAGSAATFSVMFLLGVEESQSNTAVISDNSGSPWIIVIVFAAVIGAPIAEEVVFRGVSLRIFAGIGASITNSKLGGSIIGIAISSIMFGLVHFPDGDSGFSEYMVVAVTLGTIGAILAIMAVYFDRLGPSIWAHVFFNVVGVSAALGVFEEFQEDVEAALSVGFW